MSGPAGHHLGLLRYATAPGSSSFVEFLSAAAAELLPGHRAH